MSITAIISLVAGAIICIYASISDFRTECIPNRVLLVAFALSVILALLQYAVFSPELLASFLINASITCLFSFVLFFTHTWAGGDCKLACVLTLLYPAEAYLNMHGANITLPLAIGIAFMLGSLCLCCVFLANLIRNRPKLPLRTIGSSFLAFAQSYLCAICCIGILYLLNTLFIAPHIQLNPIVIALIGFCCIWLLSNAGLLKNRVLLIVMAAINGIALLTLHTVPLGANPQRYLFVLAVVLLRIIVSQENYQTIPTSSVSQGMVLSTASTMLFLNSRIKGLPAVSTEDLRSRLTEEEAESVRRWGKSAKGSESIQVVRKMPFAIFVSLGFIVYFIVWKVV